MCAYMPFYLSVSFIQLSLLQKMLLWLLRKKPLKKISQQRETISKQAIPSLHVKTFLWLSWPPVPMLCVCRLCLLALRKLQKDVACWKISIGVVFEVFEEARSILFWLGSWYPNLTEVDSWECMVKNKLFKLTKEWLFATIKQINSILK